MIIKCKMCGGDLNIQEGNPICECEFCGTQQTVPQLDDEKKANLFNRANKLRMSADFDKAATVYASITAEYPEEAEAYWGLCLCKYGIEYVDDPVSGKKIPTCHRTLTDSIMDDNDFDQACENADPIAIRLYREEAKEIDRIQQSILSIVANEDPYDVFICYKETDEEGNRTEDSVLAQEIYDVLIEKGLKVFFSRITLEDKLGQQYEPYIYAALHSARVMLAIGTKFEYYNAVWVKNEWARFLSMLKTEKGKTLIPCYKDLDAYDMPKEFKNLQAQDMGKLGWLQDLTRGVLKLCNKDDTQFSSSQQQVNVQSVTPTMDSLLKRAFVFLEDKKWDSARGYADKILDIDVENANAYLIKLMADLKVSSREELRNQENPFGQNEQCQKIFRYGDDSLIEEIKDTILFINERNETNDKKKKEEEKKKKEAEEKAAELEKCFTEETEACNNAEKAVAQALRKKEEASSELERYEAYVKEYQTELESLTGIFSRKKRAEKEEKISNFMQYIEQAKEKLASADEEYRQANSNKPERPGKERIYQLATACCDAYRYLDAYRYYISIHDYKDVAELLQKNEGLKMAAVQITRTAPFRKAGGEVNFGHYRILGEDNGTYSIPWIVLEVKENKALLISKYGIDAAPYHMSSQGEVAWEKCSLRKWLNSDFLNKVFSKEEQKAIIATKIDNSESQGYNSSAELREWGLGIQARVCWGPTTTDKVFLLSYKEAKQFFNSNKDRMCKPSEYVKRIGKNIFPPTTEGLPESIGKLNGYGQWWLRTAEYEYSVTGMGDVGLVGGMVSSDGKCTNVLSTFELMIRPAIWLDLDSEYFMLAVEGGESMTATVINPETIINTLSECTSAREMIKKLDTMNIPHDAPMYQQIINKLEKTTQIERLYGISHEEAIRTLKNIWQ